MAFIVQSGRETGIAGLTHDVTVSAYDPTRAFLLYQFRSTDTVRTGPERWCIRGITNPGADNTKIRFQTLSTSPAVGEVTWWLVECTAGEFEVETVNDSVDGETAQINLSKAYDQTRTMLIMGNRISGTLPALPADASADSFAAVSFFDDDTVLLEHNDDEGTVSCNVTLYVVEWAAATGVTVEHGTIDDTFNNTEEAQALASSAEAALTWLYATFRHDVNNIEACSVRLRIDFSTDEIKYKRQTSTTLRQSIIRYQVVRFPSGKGVKCAHGLASAIGTDATEVLTLDQAVKAASSVVFATASCASTSNAFAPNRWTAEFTGIDGGGNTDDITFDRDYTGPASDISASVVDFSAALLLPFRPATLDAHAELPAPALAALAAFRPNELEVHAELPPPASAALAALRPGTLEVLADLPPPAVAALIQMRPQVLEALTDLQAPALAAVATLRPAAVEVLADLPAPAVAALATLSPTALEVVLDLPAPALAAVAALAPSVLGVQADLPAPAVSAAAQIRPSPLDVLVALLAPELVESTNAVTIRPATIQLLISLLAPAVLTEGPIRDAFVLRARAALAASLEAGAVRGMIATNETAAAPAPILPAGTTTADILRALAKLSE